MNEHRPVISFALSSCQGAYLHIKVSASYSSALLATCWMLINPAFGMFFLMYTLYKSNHYSRLFAVPLGLLFGSIGYNMYLKNEPDLVRYLDIVRNMSGLTFSAVLQENQDMLYVRDALFYVVSKTNDEYILPFVIGWLAYTVVFYVYFDFIQRTQYYKNWSHNGKLYAVMAILTAIGIQHPFIVIDNVRSILAYVLITYAAYRELVQGKMDLLTCLAYIGPCFFHTSAMVMLALRLVLIVFSQAGSIKYVFSVFTVLAFPAVFRFGIPLLQNIPIALVQKAVRKAVIYVEWTSGGWADEAHTYRTYWIDRIYGVPFIIIVIFFSIRLTSTFLERGRMGRNALNGLYFFRQYLFLLAIVTLCNFWLKVDTLKRFEACFCLYSPVILLPVLQRSLSGHKRVSFIMWCLLYSGVLMFLFSCALFVRWIHMNLFLQGFITTCPAFLIIKLVYAIICVLF